MGSDTNSPSPNGGGLLRHYLELQQEQRPPAKKRTPKPALPPLVESTAFANDTDSLISDVDEMLSQVRDLNAIRPDMLTRLFPRSQ